MIVGPVPGVVAGVASTGVGWACAVVGDGAIVGLALTSCCVGVGVLAIGVATVGLPQDTRDARDARANNNTTNLEAIALFEYFLLIYFPMQNLQSRPGEPSLS
jgi:hypothetical protein